MKKIVNFIITSVTFLILLGLIELVAILGLVDYRVFITPSRNKIVYKGHFWRNPTMLLDKELKYRRRPNQRLVGKTKGDIAHWCNIETNRLYQFDVQYDAFGFRNVREIKKASIILIGDSFVEAPLIPQKTHLSTRLIKKFGVDVANLGQMGYGPQQELIVLKRYGKKLQPNIVVWFFFEGNDLSDFQKYEEDIPNWHMNMFKYRSFIYNLLCALSETTAKQPSESESELDWAYKRSAMLSLTSSLSCLRMYFVVPSLPLSDSDLFSLENLKRHLLEAQKFSANMSAHFLLVYIPTKFRVYKDFLKFPNDSLLTNWYLNDLPSRFQNWTSYEGIDYIDLTPILKEATTQGELCFFPDDAHWNEKGIEVTTKAITDYIEANNWFLNN